MASEVVTGVQRAQTAHKLLWIGWGLQSLCVAGGSLDLVTSL